MFVPYPMVGRVLSLIVACIYLLYALIVGGGELFLRALLSVMFPLVLIWFPREMGTIKRGFGGMGVDSMMITKESPPIVLAFMGWVLLFLPVLAALFVWMSFL